MKILVVGPSCTRSKGGMATVIAGIRDSEILKKAGEISLFPSYIDGNIVVRYLYSLFAYARFLMIFRKYDLFHIHTASYGSTFRKRHYLKAAKRAGKKVIVHIHGAKYLVFYEGLSEKKKEMVKDFLKSADMVIALSDDWKEKFEETFGLTNCVSLENGIDTEFFKQAMCTPEQAICDPENHRNEFVFLGRLGERKGVYDLIEAVDIARKQNPEILVRLAGDGEIEKVRQIIKERRLEKNIEVVGWADQEKKVELLKNSATLILPSYNEGLPMAILEGMASGKAVISTTVGAIPEVVGEENGILIAPGDTKALADAMVALSRDTEKLRKMSGENVRKIREHFSVESMHERLASLYREAASGGK